MIVEKNKEKLILKYIKGLSKRYFYRDIKYDERGIDYTRFLKLRLTTFDKKHNFIKQITPEGFRLLWYLMTRAKQSTYINTNINMLIQNLNMTKHKIIKGLKALIDIDIIEIYKVTQDKQNQIYKTEKFDLNDSVHILIKYHDDDLYELDTEKGYRAIPYDFVYRAVEDLNEKEFTLLMFLMVRNRYYYVSEYIDEDTGEIFNNVNEIGYSFPTQDQISDVIKINRKDVNKYTDNLELKKYIKIEKNYEKVTYKGTDGKSKIKNMNFTYKVILLNKFEYIKYHIINVANEEMKGLSKELKNYINKTKVSDLLIECEGTNKLSLTIKNKLFLEQLYGNQIKEYYVEYKNTKDEDDKS